MADGEILQGQQYDQAKDLIIRFSEQMRDVPSAAAALGQAKTEVIPNDYNSSKVKIYADPTGLDTYVLSARANANLNLPDVLTGITVVYNQNKADGNYTETNTSNSGGDHRDLTVSLNGNSQGSVGLIPELIISIDPYSIWGRGVNSTRYFFYMTGAVTTATILARLTAIIGTTVLDLPLFKPKPHNLVLQGQSVSIRTDARVRQYDYASNTFSAYSLDTGAGTSFDTQVSLRVVQLSPTIHGAITVSNASQTVRAAANARAQIIGGINFPPQDLQVNAQSPLQTASVTPTTLAATTPTSVPTSGLYLVDTSIDPDKEWGRTKVFAEVVDFSIFA